MYKNEKYRIKVNIDLNNGVYIFSDESATGKTRLYKVLKDIQRWDKDVVAYTYGEYQEGISLSDVLKRNPDCKVVMLDRYDMYIGKFKQEIADYSNKCIVLVDCKYSNYVVHPDEELCFIDMGIDYITVEE